MNYKSVFSLLSFILLAFALNAQISENIVGIWRCAANEHDYLFNIYWGVHGDGTTNYVFDYGEGGQSYTGLGSWSYDKVSNILYEKFDDGNYGAGLLTWLEEDAFVLEILYNQAGQRDKGLRRYYRRVPNP